MLKKSKLKQNFNAFFLSVIYEKDFFFFFENFHLIRNSQYIFFQNFDVIKSLKFFHELKPIFLSDMVTYDSYFLEKIDYCVYQPTTTFYNFFSIKTNSYKYLHSSADNYNSINKVFKNSVWLEREQLEFFGVNFKNMYDCRNLLLEYDFDKYIFLKEYGLSGDNNYYSVFYNKVEHIKNIFNII